MNSISPLLSSGKHDSKDKLSTNILSLEDSFYYFILIEKLCKLIYTNKYDTIFLIDRSARLAYIGIVEYMKVKYPDLKIPIIYFINPDSVDNSYYNSQFKKTYPLVYGNDKLNILCIDTCLHNGGTMRKVKKIFDDVGLHISYAVMNSDISVGRTGGPDYIIDNSTYCYPFFKTRIFNKDKGKRIVCYLKPDYDFNLLYETQIRSDIFQIMRYFLGNYGIIEKGKKDLYSILSDSSVSSNFTYRSRLSY